MLPPSNSGSRKRHRRAFREGIALPSPLVDLDRKKAEIAHEALFAFAFEGYHETRLGVIARMCRIGRTAIYEYLRNKDENFFYALKHSFASGYPVMDSSEAADPGTARIFRFKVLYAEGLCPSRKRFLQFRRDLEGRAVPPGSPIDLHAGQLPGLDPEHPAGPREARVPGDVEVAAPQAVGGTAGRLHARAQRCVAPYSVPLSFSGVASPIISREMFL